MHVFFPIISLALSIINGNCYNAAYSEKLGDLLLKGFGMIFFLKIIKVDGTTSLCSFPPLLLSKNWSTDVSVSAQNLGQFKNMPQSV